MLDPTKYRLHDRFAPPIVRLTFFAGQPLGHAHRSGIQLGINRRLIFSLPPQRHQHFHSLIILRCQFRKTIFGAKPRIAQHSFGQKAEILLNRIHHRHQLLVVRRVVAKPDGHNQLTVGVDHRLGVVALFKTPAHLHDARLGIGEVILRFVLGYPERPLERPPGSIPSALLIIGMAPPLPIGLSLALFQALLGRFNLGQTILPSFELLGQRLFALIRSPLCVLLNVGLSRSLQQRFDLRFKLLFLFLHPPVAHCFVLACLRFDFGPIQRHRPKLDQSHLFGQPRHRDKQLFKLWQMPHPKFTDRSVRWKIACSQDPKPYVLVKLSRQLARREDSGGIPVHQHLDQQRWIVRLVSPPVSFVAGIKLPQLQPIDDLADEIHQMIFGQPLRRRGRRQKCLIRLVRKKGCRHDHLTLSANFSSLYALPNQRQEYFYAAQTPSANAEVLRALPAFIKGLIIPEWPMPRPWDPADATKLLTAITFAGLGGFWTLFYSYWLRDKRSGIAHYAGRLTGPITGKPEAIPDSGA